MKSNKWSNILIVDDQIENLQIINNYLEEAKLANAISLAPDTQIAFSIIEKQIPDLIITDWEMPEMDGIQFISQLKNNNATKDIPVMMCTGIMTSSDKLQLAMETGAVDFIRKPIDKTELIARVKSNLLLSEKYHEVKKLNETKDKLFAIISHDIKGPLSSAAGLSDILFNEFNSFDKTELKESLKLLNNGISQTLDIVVNLLFWANSQSNNVNVSPALHFLKPIILNILKGASFQLIEKQIDTQVECDDSIEVFSDTELLQIVLRNLVNNAIKFTPTGGHITLKASINKGNCIISVNDSGVGIPPEKLKNLFSVSNNKSTYGTNNEKGTGIGLTICKEFVELQQGSIWVESTEGKGSSFSFSIPDKKNYK